jgi:hypothetical protein
VSRDVRQRKDQGQDSITADVQQKERDMSSLLEKIAIALLGLAGGYPTYATNRKLLSELIGKLHPVTTDKSLIRFGPMSDGGYLVPDDVEGIEACLSPGIGNCSDFELACAQRGLEVYMADRSVDGPACSHPKFRFLKTFIGAFTTDEGYISIDDWVETTSLGDETDLMLQMDIEGSEYEVLLSMSARLLRRFRIIVVEFHDLPRLWSRPYYSIASRAIEKLLWDHACVHLHPQNLFGSIRKGGIEIPRIMEATFLRKDRILHSSPATVFPHPLDAKNAAGPELPLPTCWYRH